MKPIVSFLVLILAYFCGTGIIQAQTPSLLKDILNGADNGKPLGLTDINGTLYFKASDGINGFELWKSDGTSAGTVMVKNIDPTGNGSGPGGFCNVNGTVFFTANDGTHGNELWKSDGTEGGTVLVKDLSPGTANSDLSFFSNVNGRLVFKFDDRVHGKELWKSDGTEAGTTLLKDINTGADDGIGWSTRLEFEVMNGILYFQGKDAAHEDEFWKTDGTTAGTVMVKDIAVGNGSRPTQFTNVNGTLFFAARDQDGYAIWKSDGTDAGTVKVANTAFFGGGASDLTNVNGTLFFVDRDFDTGAELWKSNGTAAGTVLVKDINPGSGNSTPSLLVNVNGTLFFRADDGTSGGELWKSDGTAAGTVMVKDVSVGTGGGLTFAEDLVSVNGVLFFVGVDANVLNGYGIDLWRSDGTAAGTFCLDIYPGFGSSLPTLLTVTGNHLYLSANGGPSTGIELWSVQNVVTGNVQEVNRTQVAIYPNPATDQIILESQDFQSREVDIFNPAGQRLQTLNLEGKRTLVNVSNYPSGIYFLKVNESIRKFIKK